MLLGIFLDIFCIKHIEKSMEKSLKKLRIWGKKVKRWSGNLKHATFLKAEARETQDQQKVKLKISDN